MGGSSKSQTVGYKYYVGMHMILCHGPVDALYEVKVDDKVAWYGSFVGGSFLINSPELFGGEAREGGIQGVADFESGGPSQGQNSYLTSILGPLVPNFRGMAGIVLRKMYMGLNPYLKTWSFKVSRVHTRQAGLTQWYDVKSAIPSQGTVGGSGTPTELVPYNDTWEYITSPTATSPVGPGTDYSGGFSGSTAAAPFGDTTHPYDDSALGFPSAVTTFVDIATTVWIKKIIFPTSQTFSIRIKCDNVLGVWMNGVNVTSSFVALSSWVTEATFSNIGVFELIVSCYDTQPTMFGGNRKYLSVIVTDLNTSITTPDMNPAHILRECLTDPDWGMGYQDSDIDDTTFIAAADTLFSEGMGISILWESQSSIEEFVKLIVKHIDAALYVDNSTGKFVLKLIRNDYSVGSLITLNEDNIDKISDFSRPQFGELTNSVTVTYWDAVTGKDATLTISDSALAQMQNCTINAAIQYPGFTNASIASRVAQRDLKTLSTPLASCTIYANKDAAVLNIGKTFKLTWPDYDLTDVVMRVTGIAYGDGKSNRIRLQCVEDVFSTPSTAFIPYVPPAWTDPSQPPVAATIREVFETPYLELVQILGQDIIDGKLTTEPNLGYLGIAAAKPASEINARIFTDNGAGYLERGNLDFSPSALLNGAITQQTTTFPIDNGKSLTLVVIGSWAEIDNEIVCVTALSDISITIKRGCLDTLPATHADNAPILFWDNYGDGDQIEYVTSDSINVKLCTVTGMGQLPLMDAPVDNVVMAARAIRPYPPANIKIAGSYYPASLVDTAISLTWVHRDRKQQTATIIGFTEATIGPEAGTTYSIRLYNHITSSLLHSVDGITTLTYSSFPSPTGSYTMRLEIWSVRDGFASWQKYSHIFTFTNITRLTTEVGSTEHLLTEAGDLITTE
jgi:hypothetical protein